MGNAVPACPGPSSHMLSVTRECTSQTPYGRELLINERRRRHFDVMGLRDDEEIVFVRNAAMSSPSVSSRSTVQKPLSCANACPPQWNVTKITPPRIFYAFNESPCVIKPVPGSQREDDGSVSIEEPHVLMALPLWAVDHNMLERLQTFSQHRGNNRCVSRLHNFWQDGECMVLQFDLPQGIPLQERVASVECLTEPAGIFLYQGLVNHTMSMHRSMLWLRGCIHGSCVFVGGEDGFFRCLVPVISVLSLAGLREFVRKLADDSGSMHTLAPELKIVCEGETLDPQNCRILRDPAYQGVIDGFAVAALTLEAMTQTPPNKVDVADFSDYPRNMIDFFIRSLHASPDFRLDMDSARRHSWVLNSDSGSKLERRSRSDSLASDPPLRPRPGGGAHGRELDSFMKAKTSLSCSEYSI